MDCGAVMPQSAENSASLVDGPRAATVVQVKRKRSAEPIETLWLEVSRRPSKRHSLSVNGLTLADSEGHLLPTKLLFRRVESVSSSGVNNLSLPRLLEYVRDKKRSLEQLNTGTSKRTKNIELGKTARFEQVRSSRTRKESTEAAADKGINLYEVVRIDVEAEHEERDLQQDKTKREEQLTEGQLLSNYLPLLREHLPDLAAEIESFASPATTSTAGVTFGLDEEVPSEDFVYDVYAMDEETEGEDTGETFYPTIRVLDHDSYDWQERDNSDYDSEDSNDENNPNNDYPEEESGSFSDTSGYSADDYADQYALGSKEDHSVSDDENRKWKPRK